MENQKSQNEAERLFALYQYNILDTIPEREYDDLTLLAATICNVETSFISFMDKDKQYHKSKTGCMIVGAHTERSDSFCTHTIEMEDMMLVPDATQDERFSSNPFVTGNPKIRFYAGVQLKSSDGFNIGTFCVIDQVPKDLSEAQCKSLKILANQVTQLLELRKAKFKLERLIQIANDKLFKYAHLNAHEVRGPLARLLGLIEVNRIDDELDSKWLYNQIEKEAADIDRVLKLISKELYNDWVNVGMVSDKISNK